MCEVSDELLVLRKARLVTDDVLGALRLPVHKALNLGAARGFDRAVASLAAELRAATDASNLEAVRAAVAALDIDWRSAGPARRASAIDRALRAAGRSSSRAAAPVRGVFAGAITELLLGARRGVRRSQGLGVALELNAFDRRVADFMVRSQVNFVTNAAGARLDAFGERARRIVADGLESGLGRDDLAAALQSAAGSHLVDRAPAYWEVVAGSFVGTSRSYGQLSSYAEAGIERYQIEAVLDERTTNICRFLHGKVFEVGDALRRFERIEALDDPEEVKTLQPWVREARDSETGRLGMFVQRGDARSPIAEVTRSGVGMSDDAGAYAGARTNRELMELGVSFPPYHGLCRTGTVANP